MRSKWPVNLAPACLAGMYSSVCTWRHVGDPGGYSVFRTCLSPGSESTNEASLPSLPLRRLPMSTLRPYPTARQQTAAARLTAAITNSRLCLHSPVDPLWSGLLVCWRNRRNRLITSADRRRHSRALHREMEGRQAAVKPSIWNANGPFFVGGPWLGTKWFGPALNTQQIISLWGSCSGIGGVVGQTGESRRPGSCVPPSFRQANTVLFRPTSQMGFGETGKAGFDTSHPPPW